MVPDNAVFSTSNRGATELPLGDLLLGRSGKLSYHLEYASRVSVPSSQAVGRKGSLMHTHVIRGVLICGVITGVTGCSHYYRVADLETTSTYYTKKIHEISEGAVKFKDERTGNTVRLHSSEVQKVSEDRYEAAVKEPPLIVIPPPVVREPPGVTEPPAAKQP